MPKALGVPYRVTVRLDNELRQALAHFQKTYGGDAMNVAQAIRMAIAIALRPEGQSPAQTFDRRAFREGLFRGLAAFKSGAQTLIHEMEGG